MLIIGAKGFAKEVLEVFHQLNELDNIAFYDDVNADSGDLLYGLFPILKSENEVKDFFYKYGNDFTIGIGNPQLRYILMKKFISLGGNLISCISNKAIIGSYEVKIGNGCNVLDNAIFSNSASVGKGCIIYYNVTITHDCEIGDFVELSPGATLLGSCKIGSFSKIGSNATILPKIIIGRNVTIGAGAVVTKDIPDNCVAAGIPAKIIKDLDPMKL
ncbi:MAG: acetyltransferase [Flavobacterium sp.]|uniref:acetyltransferase n=1 Tax=Flavobacterium sp. TaxID=239 RepID=UPI002618B4E8|nr:acetyltransferase [Flavobacterium sp.]MDD5151331.1 acetyltransferase [Flavobacterium sp.]